MAVDASVLRLGLQRTRAIGGLVAASEVLRRVVAASLLLTGAAVWAFSAWATAGVLAAEWEQMWGDPRHNESIDPGQGQLATALFDVQVGALLVLGCAVAVLLCRSVRGLGDLIGVLVGLPCVLIVVNAVLARVVGSSLTAAVTGGVVLVVVCVGFAWVASSRFMPSPQHRHDSSAGRLLLLAFALMAAGAVLVLDGLEPAGWIVEVLPGLVAISVVQGALIAAMLGLVAVMAVRWSVAVLAAAAVIAVVGGWVVLAPVSTRSDGPGIVALGVVLVTAAATAAVGVSDDPPARPLRRLLAVAAAVGAFCVAWFPAFLGGIGFGILFQSLAGGELGADGLPLLMGGVFAGLAALAGYAFALMWQSQPLADQPSESPTGDLLEQTG